MERHGLKVLLVPYMRYGLGKGGLQQQVDHWARGLTHRGFDVRLASSSSTVEGFDIVHIVTIDANGLAFAKAAERSGAATVFSPVLSSSYSWAETGRAILAGHWAPAWVEIAGAQEIARNSDVVVALNEGEAAVARKALGVPAAKIVVVPNGVDRKFVETPATPPSSTKVAVQVGRLDANKRPDHFIDASVLSGHVPILVGPLGPDEGFTSSVIERLDRVGGEYLGVFSPGSSSIVEAYDRSSVVCLASRQEVSPISILEAKARHRPVAVSWHLRLLARSDPGVFSPKAPGTRSFANAMSAASGSADVPVSVPGWDWSVDQLASLYMSLV